MVASSSSSSFVLFFLLLVACSTTVTAFDNFYEENALYAGQRLRANEALRWGQNKLIMQSDCNFCYHSGWCCYSQGGGNDCSAFLHQNGNIAVYGNNGALRWQSNTGGARGDYVLLVQEDNNAVLYGRSIWSTRDSWRPSATATALDTKNQERVAVGVGAQPPSDGRYIQNVLYEGERLLVNQELRSKSYRLVMQPDCNLVLYNAYTDIWRSNTSGLGTHCSVGLGNGGNLVIYNELGYPVWHSGSSSGSGDYILILQNDGVAMIYSKVLWSALTFKPRGLTTNSNSTSSSKISMVTSNE